MPPCVQIFSETQARMLHIFRTPALRWDAAYMRGGKKKVKQILKANRKELDSKRVANAVPTGAARIALLNLDLSSLSLSFLSPLSRAF